MPTSLSIWWHHPLIPSCCCCCYYETFATHVGDPPKHHRLFYKKVFDLFQTFFSPSLQVKILKLSKLWYFTYFFSINLIQKKFTSWFKVSATHLCAVLALPIDWLGSKISTMVITDMQAKDMKAVQSNNYKLDFKLSVVFYSFYSSYQTAVV